MGAESIFLCSQFLKPHRVETEDLNSAGNMVSYIYFKGKINLVIMISQGL